jgi:PilZ domain
MVETRIAPRHRVSKAATIKFVGGAVDCVIRDLSITGAAIEVTSPANIPKSFVLVVPDDGLQLSCQVVWRKQFRIGVKFD